MINVSAVIQVAILYAVIYAILKAAKGSRFGQVLAGVGLVAAAMFLFTYVFHFDVLTTIVRTLLAYLAISTVVIFQPEIRRILSQLGTFGTSDRPKYSAGGAADPGYVTDVLLALAERRIGALVAFERGISLRGYEETGVATDALFSRELDAKEVNLIAVPEIRGEVRLKAKVRYRQREEWATVRQTDGDRIHVVFDEPQRAITKGQSVVLYDGDVVYGGGVIC